MSELSIDQTLLPLATAFEQVTGRRPHLSSIIRWAKKGSRGVYLQVTAIGSRYYVTPEAVRQFIAATTSAVTESQNSPVNHPPHRSRSAAAREKAVNRAKNQLKKVGL